MQPLTLVENLVAEIEGVRLAAGQFWEGSCRISVMGESPEMDYDRRVRPGDVLTIGRRRYRVTSLTDPPDAPGSVTLTPLPPSD